MLRQCHFTILKCFFKILSFPLIDFQRKQQAKQCSVEEEQKGCRKKSRGTKDQLLIDKAVLKEARLKKRCLSMAWEDYRKAYDMVPHLWILKVLNLSKVAGNLEIFMKNSMASWQTNLLCNGENLGEVKIKRGIFQGDSLSPLLFIMVMMPLSIL